MSRSFVLFETELRRRSLLGEAHFDRRKGAQAGHCPRYLHSELEIRTMAACHLGSKQTNEEHPGREAEVLNEERSCRMSKLPTI